MKHIIEHDADAAVIWASYDPQLNKRSRADFNDVFGLSYRRLEAVTPEIHCGLNVLDLSKLGVRSLLYTESDRNSYTAFLESLVNPANGGNLYLFVDEAHIGAKRRSGDASILVQVATAVRENAKVSSRAQAIVAVTATPDRVMSGLFAGDVAHVRVLRSDVVKSGDQTYRGHSRAAHLGRCRVHVCRCRYRLPEDGRIPRGAGPLRNRRANQHQ